MESLAVLPQPTIPNETAQPIGISMAHWAAEKKAHNLRLYDVAEHCSYADHVLICSGTSDRHVVAIAEYLREQCKKAGYLPLGVEGFQQGHWVLLDFGDAIAHVFYEPVREYYELDRMWSHTTQVEIPGVTVGTGAIDLVEDPDLDEDE